MTHTDPRGPARYANGRFGPGNPGRRPGSKNHSVSDRLAAHFLADFERDHADILAELRYRSPAAYLSLFAQLLPKHVPFAAEAAEPTVDNDESTVEPAPGGS